MKTTLVSLNDYELSMLDQIARPEIQPAIDAAIARRELEVPPGMPEKLWDMFRVVMQYAHSEGRLTRMHRRINHCTVCDKRGTYAKYKRDGRYHKKGDFNYKKPIELSGTGFGNVWTRMCSECFQELKPWVLEATENMKVELSRMLTGELPKYTRYAVMLCDNCNWQGHKGLMRKLPALMGGYYRGGCPECDAANLPFGRHLINREKDGGFEVHETQGEWEHPR